MTKRAKAHQLFIAVIFWVGICVFKGASSIWWQQQNGILVSTADKTTSSISKPILAEVEARSVGHAFGHYTDSSSTETLASIDRESESKATNEASLSEAGSSSILTASLLFSLEAEIPAPDPPALVDNLVSTGNSSSQFLRPSSDPAVLEEDLLLVLQDASLDGPNATTSDTEIQQNTSEPPNTTNALQLKEPSPTQRPTKSPAPVSIPVVAPVIPISTTTAEESPQIVLPLACRGRSGHLRRRRLDAYHDYKLKTDVPLPIPLCGAVDSCPFVPNYDSLAMQQPAVSLRPGELPGYTGWSRQPFTLSTFYDIVYIGSSATITNQKLDIHDETPIINHSPTHNISQAGVKWSVVVHCPAEQCHGTRPTFYARSYGPAILAGDVQRIEMESEQTNPKLIAYEVIFHYRFPGLYTVEVVMEISDAWTLNRYPQDAWNERPPEYEGWMLPGFPLQLQVAGDDASASARQRWCGMEELVGVDHSAQWITTGRNSGLSSHGPVEGSQYHDDPNGDQYAKQYNTIGVCTEYVKKDCLLLPTSKILSEQERTSDLLSQCMRHSKGISNSTKLNIIVVGDSVGRANVIQLKADLHLLVDIPEERVYVTVVGEIYSGISTLLAPISKKMDSLLDRDERRVVFFNAGLHDIGDTCTIGRNPSDETKAMIDSWPGKNCYDGYRSGFRQLVAYINSYDADLKVFRTTNAGWMRWGNFGFQWAARNTEISVLSTLSTRILNDAALEIIDQSGGDIKVLDLYWPSLARPDNTQVNNKNSPGAHMVHPGHWVMRLLVRTQVMMILRHFCSDLLEEMLII